MGEVHVICDLQVEGTEIYPKKLHFLLIRTGQDDLDCWKRRVCRKRRRNEQ